MAWGERERCTGLLLNYDRNARLALMLTCAGLGGRVLQRRRRRTKKEALQSHPIGTKMEPGIYPWLWRCRMASAIEINETVLVKGLNGERRSCHPDEIVLLSGTAGY